MWRKCLGKVVLLGCALPCVAARISVSPKLGAYGDARGGPDLWGLCIKATDAEEVSGDPDDTEMEYLPPRYAPETPLVGLDVAFRAENGFLLQLTVDAALTRLMFRGQCLAGYSFRPGGVNTYLSVAAGFECTALIYDSYHYITIQAPNEGSVCSFEHGGWYVPKTVLSLLRRRKCQDARAESEELGITGICQNYAVPVQLGVQHYFGAHWGIDATATVSFGVDTKLAKFRIPYTLRVGPVFRT
ncbi:DUF2715 domain-containing protein [Treponema pallidum]|nr:DUF2715 domain-containing protein [Treponema pallidum]QUK11019.1 DUF2715 domain-containing protein [Treponema pallidum]QUK64471.1 DUF2715 domain-containing protein [Treponema pallidum]UWV11388.1 DUF2715 domain-containing protein [Treponema pallidum]WBG11555.1 DUF2715 domain-containing protein [Treponema pallidum]WBO97357.1 DUF2715 domain-containing protein [Treponema pallidum]